MFRDTLKTDIYTFDNKILLKAGSRLTTEILEDLVASNKDSPYDNCALLHYDSIRKDLISYISSPPYQGIFSIGEEFGSLLRFMENVCLPMPVLQALNALKKHDLYTYRHTLTVFALSTLLATYLIDDFKDRVEKATSSPSHDLGKLCVSVNILQKATPLTRNEMDIMKQHTIIGYVLLSYYFRDMDYLSAVVARDHHEKRTGTGSPRGINLDNQTVEIVVACDIYDALISPRPYRSASFDNRGALEVLTEMSDKKEITLDIVRLLVALNRKDKPHYKDCEVSRERRIVTPETNNYGIIDDSRDDTEKAGND